MFKKTQLFLAAVSVSALMLAACGTESVKDTSNQTEATPPPPVATEPAPTTNLGGSQITAAELSAQHSIYFDFDKSDIKADGEPVVTLWATYLTQTPAAKVRIEGNCDERGSREYNIGLGERRANAIAQALEAKGVAPSQVSVISYGKEKPVCSEHNEACWSKNRRGDLVQQ
jgi:peptidoglycan-associated lipoprotein